MEGVALLSAQTPPDWAYGGAGILAAGLAPRASILSGVASAQDAEPVSGGSISMSLADQDAQSFDPPAPIDNMSIWTMLLFYDQLVRVNSDGTAIEPGLAESWSASEDGTVYTFNLREATFHDGTPVTAADVAYCIDRAINLEGGAWSFIYSALSSVEATDEKTVVMTLVGPWAPLEADLAMFTASIYPKAAHEEQGDDLFQNPIGSGAYSFVSWDKDQQIVLAKNPSWWDTGKPYIDELTFKVLPDSNARMLQFQAGELDIATNVPFNQLEALQSNPDVKVVLDAVARIDYIGLNTIRPPFDDVKVRQAINYAVDKQSIIDNVLFGYGEIANSFLPKMPGRNPDQAPYPYDLDMAKQLMAESSSPDGFEGELIVQAGEAVDVQVCQLVAAALSEIGGNITISQIDGGTLIDRIYTAEPDFDLCKVYYTTDIVDPDELASFAVASDGGTLAVGTSYKNDQVDQLIKDSQSNLDPASRQEVYNQIQQIVMDDAHFLYLFYPSGRTAIQSYVENFHVLPTGNYRLYESWRNDL